MQLLRLLIQQLWPSDHSKAAPDIGERTNLKPLIAIAIVLLCGPEIFAAADLLVLLDVLGSVLFLVAFSTGLKILGLSVVDQIQRIFLPPRWVALLAAHEHPTLIASGIVLTGRNAVRILLLSAAALTGLVGAIGWVP